MVTFVMERGVPAEVVGQNMHRLRDLIAVRTDQVFPSTGMIVAILHGIFALQRDDMRPDIAGVILQLVHRFLQIDNVIVTE